MEQLAVRRKDTILNLFHVAVVVPEQGLWFSYLDRYSDRDDGADKAQERR